MKSKLKTIYRIAMALLCTAVIIPGCKDKVDLPDQPLSKYNQVYMPQAVNSPVNSILKITDQEQTLVYGANYGGQDYPDGDITLKFAVMPNLVDSFNLANNTNYELLPAEGYTMSGLEAMIPKGKLSTEPLKVSVITKGPKAIEALKNYILPIRIVEASFKVNESLRTTFFTIKAQPDFADYPDFDRTKWSIIDFSSEEVTGEGANNGKAIYALDNNSATYWHSQWQGASPGPPHFLMVDMGETKTIHGVNILPRQSDDKGKPNLVSIETSEDNVTWEAAGSFNLLNQQNGQKQFLSGFRAARYFKFTVLSSYDANYVHLAELGAF